MKKYYVKANSRWTEIFTDKRMAQAFARTYGTRVKTKVEPWQVNTAIVITLIVMLTLFIVFTS